MTSINNGMKSFMKRYTQFLRTDSPYSAMRMATTLMIATTCFYVIFQTILKLPVDWWGAAGFATVALGGKMLQKKDEVKAEIAENSTNNTNDAATNPNDSANPS